MSAYSKVVLYDLRAPGRNYIELISALKGYPICEKLTESAWLISTGETCVQVRDKLSAKIDSNDRLLVITLTGEAAWRNLLCDNQRLKDIL